MVLIVGNGRSGTNWMGRILNSHPDITCDIEREPQFSLSVAALTDKGVLPDLVSVYLNRQVGGIYASKDHVNLWHLEYLFNHIPNLKVICMRRDVYAVVASGLKHAGILSHITGVKSPLSANIVPEYDSLSIAAKLTLRWLLHDQRWEQVKSKVHTVNFEALVSDPIATLQAVSDYLGITALQPPTVKKYNTNYVDVEIIDATIARYGHTNLLGLL